MEAIYIGRPFDNMFSLHTAFALSRVLLENDYQKPCWRSLKLRARNIERFDDQKQAFRTQVTEGRGFGPSPLFPPNLLPSIENEPQLARCMIPTFGRAALPERALNQLAPLYELAVPRPGLGCGFGSFAFSIEELAALPQSLVVAGTAVDFGTGFICPSSAIYCPFLTFERTYGNKEHRMEAANNRCAIDGAWCCRALQMFYEKAHQGERIPADNLGHRPPPAPRGFSPVPLERSPSPATSTTSLPSSIIAGSTTVKHITCHPFAASILARTSISTTSLPGLMQSASGQSPPYCPRSKTL